MDDEIHHKDYAITNLMNERQNLFEVNEELHHMNKSLVQTLHSDERYDLVKGQDKQHRDVAFPSPHSAESSMERENVTSSSVTIPERDMYYLNQDLYQSTNISSSYDQFLNKTQNTSKLQKKNLYVKKKLKSFSPYSSFDELKETDCQSSSNK